MSEFDYSEAFSRNLGLVTRDEQDLLSKKTVAIAGMGGVGGIHAVTLARMGVQSFNIADLDIFELANFNRQIGATMDSIGRPKVEVIRDMILAINPNAKIRVYDQGVNDDNIDEFIGTADIYVDGLDYFVLETREKVFMKCREKGIYAVSAGPLGVSTSFLVFDPKGCSFKDYFGFKQDDKDDMAVRMLVGYAPKLAHRNHIVDMSFVDFKAQKGPSLSPACMACSAIVGAQVLKILLGRGRVHVVPWVMQFDLLLNKFHKVYNIGGNKNPINKIKIKAIKRILKV